MGFSFSVTGAILKPAEHVGRQLSTNGQFWRLEVVGDGTGILLRPQGTWKHLDKNPHYVCLVVNESIENPDWIGNLNNRDVIYRNNGTVSGEQLRSLFADARPDKGSDCNYTEVLTRSLGYVCAYFKKVLVGFVYVAWDGGSHAFLLDPTVRTDVQRQGVGSELVRRATDLARSKGVEWLHVDFEPHLYEFYRKCSFKEIHAGLIRLND